MPSQISDVAACAAQSRCGVAPVLNNHRVHVDAFDVCAWLEKVRTALGGESESRAAARAQLQDALRTRMRIEIRQLDVPDDEHGEPPPALASSIEQVRDDDLVISQPTVGGFSRQLTASETLRISVIGGDGRVSGVTRCLGRVQIPSGLGRQMLYGYRLEIPEVLEADDRRGADRVIVGYEFAPRAELLAANVRSALRGVVVDLSVGGAKVRVDRAESRLLPGQEALVRIDMPDPIGPINMPVTIARVEPSVRSEQIVVGLQFKEPLPQIEPFLRSTQIKRARRGR